jgi:hypoxanthine phosphoribosyltransferase
MPQRPGGVLIAREEIAVRVTELGRAIAREHAGSVPLLVGVLKGAAVFMADLIRAIPSPVAIDFMAVSSYGSGARSSGAVRLTADLSVSIEGRDVILVEDIVDTGRTLHYLRRNLETRHPRSLKVCTLLDKIERRQADLDLDLTYVGFVIPDRFVVGYGFDLAGQFRGLPEIHVLVEDQKQD